MGNYFNCNCCGSETIFKDLGNEYERKIDEADLDKMSQEITTVLRTNYHFDLEVHDPLFLMVKRLLMTDTLSFLGIGVREAPEAATLQLPEVDVEKINRLTLELESVLRKFGVEIQDCDSMRNLRGGIDFKLLRPLGIPSPEYDDHDTFGKPSAVISEE